ncbi:hypothetical protein [Staphylococcus phage vB_StaM_SA1]|nr:hypothetical protein [Staphylococcus phage vB_StaM_SA1]
MNNKNKIDSKIDMDAFKNAMTQAKSNLNNLIKIADVDGHNEEINRLKKENEEMHRFLFKLYQEDEYDKDELKKILYKDVVKKFI